MIVLMKCLNEAKTARRCLNDFHELPWVERIIVIDGWSTDFTVPILEQFRKVEAYLHRWEDWYHDMEVAQSNIALSYIPHGQICFILDFDERMSDELKKALEQIDRDGMPENVDICSFSRKTVEPLRYKGSPYAMLDESGWPIISHQIGQYPDFQCRLIRRRPEMHWINSPHHILSGYERNVNIQRDIIHYEKDDFREREFIEKKWALARARRIELGLTADAFEVVNRDVQSWRP